MTALSEVLSCQLCRCGLCLSPRMQPSVDFSGASKSSDCFARFKSFSSSDCEPRNFTALSITCSATKTSGETSIA